MKYYIKEDKQIPLSSGLRSLNEWASKKSMKPNCPQDCMNTNNDEQNRKFPKLLSEDSFSIC